MTRDNELAAQILAEQFITNESDGTVAKKYGIARKTVIRYRAALTEDAKLSQLFKEKLQELLTRHWADELDQTLRATINKLKELIETSTELNDVVAAFSALSETAITKEVLSAAANARTGTAYGTEVAASPQHYTASHKAN